MKKLINDLHNGNVCPCKQVECKEKKADLEKPESRIDVKREVIDLLEWIADNQEKWLDICPGERLDTEQCLELVEIFEEHGFVQLIPVVLTQCAPDPQINKAITRLSLLKIAEGWKGKEYKEISKELRKEFSDCIVVYE